MKNLMLSQFKIGYYILYKNCNFYGNIIEGCQLKEGFPKVKAEYVHIEMSLGGQYSINAVFPKIKLTDITKERIGSYVKIVKPRIKDYSSKRKNVAIECMKRINKWYGLGVIWFIIKDTIKRNIFSAIGDFCSELCGYGLWSYYVKYRKKEYTDILPKPYNQLYPADFLDERYFEVVCEGYISESIK